MRQTVASGEAVTNHVIRSGAEPDFGNDTRNWLGNLDSNQDILNQNQLYYPYTIGQSDLFISEWGAKIGEKMFGSKF